LHHSRVQAPGPTQRLQAAGPQLVGVSYRVLSIPGVEIMGRWAVWCDDPESLAMHHLPGHPEPRGLPLRIDFLLLLLLISALLVPRSRHCRGCSFNADERIMGMAIHAIIPI